MACPKSVHCARRSRVRGQSNVLNGEKLESCGTLRGRRQRAGRGYFLERALLVFEGESLHMISENHHDSLNISLLFLHQETTRMFFFFCKFDRVFFTHGSFRRPHRPNREC